MLCLRFRDLWWQYGKECNSNLHTHTPPFPARQIRRRRRGLPADHLICHRFWALDVGLLCFCCVFFFFVLGSFVVISGHQDGAHPGSMLIYLPGIVRSGWYIGTTVTFRPCIPSFLLEVRCIWTVTKMDIGPAHQIIRPLQVLSYIFGTTKALQALMSKREPPSSLTSPLDWVQKVGSSPGSSFFAALPTCADNDVLTVGTRMGYSRGL